MHLNYLAFVVPLFCLFCGLEYYFSLKKERKLFSFSETVSNLNVGIFERSCDLFTTAALHFYFVWLYDHFALFSIPPSPWIWISMFLITDLLWYGYHRFGHRVNILWAAHVVHHQSEDFNFTVSARITMFQAFFRALFWSFIPMLGFPPELMTGILLLHGAYPFFTHTQLVGKLGWVEKVFVTPSHHRAHHSSNPEYLDKNFGDVLIIWDKIFGTFAEEDSKIKPVYGITDALNSYSFLWQHFHYAAEIWVSFWRADSWKGKWTAVFGSPEQIDPNIRHELEIRLLARQRQREIAPVLTQFIAANTVLGLVFVFFFLLFGYQQDLYQLLAGGTFVPLSVIHTGAMLEQRRWVFHLECVRCILLSVYLMLLVPNPELIAVIVASVTTLILFYNSAQRNYLRALQLETSRI